MISNRANIVPPSEDPIQKGDIYVHGILLLSFAVKLFPVKLYLPSNIDIVVSSKTSQLLFYNVNVSFSTKDKLIVYDLDLTDGS